MRILFVHNFYQNRGGEDSVVESEIALLRAHGHDVETLFRHNDEFGDILPVTVARQALWSGRTTRDMSKLLASFKPDVVHCHNTFPLVSPSVYWSAIRFDTPVVQTLHNFRLMCLNALFMREGRVCEDCIGRHPWRGVVRKCYRGSSSASAVLTGMLTLHRGLGTYRNKVARYIALNEFCRNKFIEGGLPAERITVKPNFVDFPPPISVTRQGLLFVGRLSVEKGVKTLADAAASVPGVNLRIVGAGPAASFLDGIAGIRPLGSLSNQAVRTEMNSAIALVIPSICYENFPRTIVEAFATGLPVIASRIGALAELVREGETGLLFDSGSSKDLAKKMAWALAHPEEMAEMGGKARMQYEAEFTAERNYGQLMAIYDDVIRERRNAN